MKIAASETRQRALAAYEQGKATQREIARLFGVSMRTFQRWQRQYERERTTHPYVRGHRLAVYRGPALKRLDRMIQQHPDASLEELRQLTAHSCSIMAVQRAVVRLGYGLKKTLSASEQKRPDIARRRNQWRAGPLGLDGRGLVFVDESSAKTNMTRLRGRALRGRRVISYAPHGHWSTTTMIGSIRLDGATSCLAIDGATSSEVWREYVRQVLCPTLRRGDIVIVDNLAAHKDLQGQRLIEDCGAQLMFLPPYSPDLNPIENMWSKIKAHLRKAEARSYERLIEAIGQAFAAITAKDAQGYFFSCGYTTSQT
jgi:transposase